MRESGSFFGAASFPICLQERKRRSRTSLLLAPRVQKWKRVLRGSISLAPSYTSFPPCSPKCPWSLGGHSLDIPSLSKYGSVPLLYPSCAFSQQCSVLMSRFQSCRSLPRIELRGSRLPSASYLLHLSFPICKVEILRIPSLASTQ